MTHSHLLTAIGAFPKKYYRRYVVSSMDEIVDMELIDQVGLSHQIKLMRSRAMTAHWSAPTRNS
jgi:hypothetical protein